VIPRAQSMEIAIDAVSPGSYMFVFTDEKSTIYRKMIIKL